MQVEPPRRRAAPQRLVGGVVLLLRRAVRALAVGEQARPGGGPFAQARAVPPGVAGQGVALQDGGRGLRRRLRVLRAVGRGGGVVFQFRVARQREGALQQGLVELEHFGAVLELGLGVRIGRADAHVAAHPGGRRLGGVELLLQAEVDQVARPGRGAERADVRIDASNAGHDEVRVREVELRAQGQRHRRGRGVGVAHAGGHDADARVGALDLRILCREPRHADGLPDRQLLEPGRGLGPEQRDDHHLDGPGGRRLGGRGAGDEERGRSGEQRAGKDVGQA